MLDIAGVRGSIREVADRVAARLSPYRERITELRDVVLTIRRKARARFAARKHRDQNVVYLDSRRKVKRVSPPARAKATRASSSSH